jgi:hypothetical protein
MPSIQATREDRSTFLDQTPNNRSLCLDCFQLAKGHVVLTAELGPVANSIHIAKLRFGRRAVLAHEISLQCFKNKPLS